MADTRGDADPLITSGAQLYSTSSGALPNEALINILINPNLEKASTIQPVMPKGGDIYLLDFRANPEKRQDARADKVRWRQDKTKKWPIPPNEVNLVKTYFYVALKEGEKTVKSSKFKKNISYLSSQPLLQVVEYIGDENVFQPFPHALSKDCTNFVRTAPSVLGNIRENLKSSGVSNTYKKMVVQNNMPQAQGILNPRNMRQVWNLKQELNSEKRISRDDLYNLLLLAYHLEDFVLQIDLFPDVDCILGSPEIFKLFNEMLTLQSNDFQLVLYYDTTFKVLFI